MSSTFSTVSCLLIYILIDENQNFDSKTVFVSISLIQTLKHSLTAFPDVISSLIRTKSSFNRIINFLNRDEIKYSFNEKELNDSNSNSSIFFDNTSFCWDEREEPILKRISADIPTGALVAVIGDVGCGKSALLSSIVGELYKLEGELHIKGSIAYVPNDCWLQQKTIKENILFCNNYDHNWYQNVIYSCALIPDFRTFPAGDETEVGENGVSLSGGQKQRICLSRAVYNNSDVYLLDDPLYAVDLNTAKHIFHEVIGPKGLLAKKTRLWVTNDHSFLDYCHSVIVLKNGRIESYCSFDEIKRNTNFKANLQTENKRVEHLIADNSSETCGTLVKEEELKNKEITLDDFFYYIKHSGIKLVLLTLISLLLSSFCETTSDYWITHWTDNYLEISPIFGIKVFLTLVTIQSCLVTISNITSFSFSNKVSYKLFQLMLKNTMHLRMEFFDETPIGRVMTRFSRDLSVIESALPYNMIFFLQNAIKLLVVYFVIISLSIHLSIIIAIVLLCGYGLHKFYSNTSQQLNVLNLHSISPINHIMSESSSGLTTIRAFNAQNYLINEFNNRIDINANINYFISSANRWLGIWTSFLNAIILFSACILVIKNFGSMSAGMAGFLLTNSIKIVNCLTFAIRCFVRIESNFVSIKRVKEYIELKSEINENKLTDIQWPTDGSIEFRNFNASYKIDSKHLALSGINLTINKSQKVGIIGRTGSGKSSIALSLLRIFESTSGQILIDGIDISSIELHKLRSSITIIPQDPTLFSGSLRFNIDPTNEHKDEELLDILIDVQLSKYLKTLSKGLDYEIIGNGDNLSSGQKQLICLARAILKKNKILILDESTACVDRETDTHIQSIIKKYFSKSTIITIAHRLDSILQNDTIIVLSNGSVVESGRPRDLIEDSHSLLYKLKNQINY